MGIPGLTSRLNNSAREEALGCCNAECDRQQDVVSVVIDGPSLAYWVYSNLARGFIVKEDTHTRPSFRLLGHAVLDVLSVLEQHKIKILRIYFDGGLPAWKTTVRKDRLRKDHQQRKALRAGNPTFKLMYSSDASVQTEDLFKASSVHHKSNIDLVSPFLVPIVIETLQQSIFSDRTEIVPDEADAWCAAFARAHEATILTNDSDLAVYDLENGQMVFLDSLRKSVCDHCMASCINASVLQPMKTAQALGASDIQHAAFDLSRLGQDQKGSTSKYSKTHLDHGHASMSLTTSDYEEFCRRYSNVDLEQDRDVRKMIQHLDPRLSEVVEQLRSSDGHVTSILPSMVEDPIRKSVWSVSESIRDFSYSLLWQITSTKDAPLFEYIEKGQPAGDGRRVSLFSKKQRAATCSSLLEFLQGMRKSSEDIFNNVSYWRTICTIHVCYWCLATDFSSREELRSHSNAILSRSRSHSLSWSQIHFRGQLEATYYAFRQLSQILKLLELHEKLDRVTDARTLHQMMAGLPRIVEMFEDQEPSLEHVVGIDFIMRTAQDMLKTEDKLSKK